MSESSKMYGDSTLIDENKNLMDAQIISIGKKIYLRDKFNLFRNLINVSNIIPFAFFKKELELSYIFLRF